MQLEGTVKLIRIKDGAQVEKSITNWKNLPAAQKSAYTVVSDDSEVPLIKKVGNTPAPPEVIELLNGKGKPANDEAPDTKEQELADEKPVAEEGKESPTATAGPEPGSVEDKIVNTFNEKLKSGLSRDEAKKQTWTDLGQHPNKVKKVVDQYAA